MEKLFQKEAEIKAKLETIEKKILKENHTLGELGFWKIVSEVKRDQHLINIFAEQIGRIEQIAHRKKWLSVDLKLGHLYETLISIFGTWLLYIGVFHQNGLIRGIGLVFSAFLLSYSFHPLTHYIVGRLLGIRFLYYFPHGIYIFFRSPGKSWWKIEPSLKIDYNSYLRASPLARVVMHASGPIVTKITILLILIINLNASLWSTIGLTVMLISYITTDIFYSTKSADWKRVLREWRYFKMRPQKPLFY